MDRREDLKPCPFCGGKPEKRLAVGEWWVSCPTCTSHSKGCSNYDAAITAWNRRALPLSLGEESEHDMHGGYGRCAGTGQVWVDDSEQSNFYRQGSCPECSPLPHQEGGRG